MRTDMAQLLVETPRRHSGEFFKTHRRKAKQNLDMAPTKQGMRRPYVERKDFGEYFAPLLGFLRKNAGRPWDKVYSELSASLHGGGTVIEHTKTHLLRDFVVLKPVFIDKKPHHPPPHFGRMGASPLNDAFYVDPYGILRWAPAVSRKKHRTKPGSEIVRINDQTAYIKIDGAWFRVWLRSIPMATKAMLLFDIVLKKKLHCIEDKPFRWRKDPVAVEPGVKLYKWVGEGGGEGTWELNNFYGAHQYAYRKEQISSRTIRREGLED